MPKVALSVKQPWAWLIVNGHKPLENRGSRTSFRGDVFIHASKGMTVKEYEECVDFVAREVGNILIPSHDRLPRGGIVGLVEIYDSVDSSDSPWFVGPWGHLLRNAYPLPLQPCLGALGFWKINEALTSGLKDACGGSEGVQSRNSHNEFPSEGDQSVSTSSVHAGAGRGDEVMGAAAGDRAD